MWQIPLFDLNYDHREQEAVLAVLKDKWLSTGPRTRTFEERFGAYLGDGALCTALSSGTAALHIALAASGIGPGDEVILPALTFVADLNVVMAVGATPVLADSTSLSDWNISADDVARKITGRTRAVIAVHFAGWPCDMAELQSLCRERGILLIEDAAHAVGASYRGVKCGLLGDMACFSFFSNKNLAVGEGGMFVCRDPELMERARRLRSHGMTTLSIDRHKGRAVSYDVTAPGFNYRMDEIRAALGIVQLEKLEHANEKRRALDLAYRSRLSGISGLTVPWNPGAEPDKQTTGHIFPILLDRAEDRPEFMAFLKERGIQTSIHYPPFPDFSCYREMLGRGPEVAGDISGRAVTLPLYPDMTFEAVETVAAAAGDFFDRKETP